MSQTAFYGVGMQHKNRHHQGSFEKLADGRVRWRVWVTYADGTKKRVKGTAPNQTEATKAVQRAQIESEAFQAPVSRNYTVEEMVGDYIAVREQKWAFRTLENNKDLLARHISPRLGSLKASEITARRLTAFYQELTQAGLGSSGQHQIAALLSGAYKLAIAEHLVRLNPTQNAKPRRVNVSRADRAYTSEQAAAFFKAAQDLPMAWVLNFLLLTGMRIGEALALQWSDVEFHPDGEATVHITKTRSEHRGKAYENEAKTHTSKRRIRVEKLAADILRQRQERGKVEGRLVEEPPSEYVFTTVRPAGRQTRRIQPMRQDSIRGSMRRICLQAGVPVRSPHALRHTYTSLLAEQGVQIAQVSRMLGHAKVSTTSDIYLHAFEKKGKAFSLNLPLSAEDNH